MKSKGISVLILSISLILSSTLILVSFGLSKPKPKSELITFSGDLVGSQEVGGCCPNAGPNPAYTMTLSETFPEEFQGTHTGYIFLNYFGRRMPWNYKVQFWWTEGVTEYFIEIRGGDIEWNKKTKVLIVTFDMEKTYEIWIDDELKEAVTVTFNLTRDPQKW